MASKYASWCAWCINKLIEPTAPPCKECKVPTPSDFAFVDEAHLEMINNLNGGEIAF